MSKMLIIAEKPSVARDIAAALGGFEKVDGVEQRDDCIVAAAAGHLVQIGVHPDQDPGFDLDSLPVIPSPFILQPIEKTKKLLNVIKNLAHRPDVGLIINACDAGREGELIFRLIMGYIGNRKPIERMWLQTMTTAGIRASFNKRKTDQEMRPLSSAAKARAEADWLVGINATRCLTESRIVKVTNQGHELISAGRVQTPVLALVVDLENRILNFKEEAFWEVKIKIEVSSGFWQASYYGSAVELNNDKNSLKRFFDRKEAEAIANKCNCKEPSSTIEKIEPVSRKPPLPYDLTTLQREANTKHGFSAAETLKIAQALYETHKVQTYPRTDSRNLPEDYVEKVIAILPRLKGGVREFALKVVEENWVSLNNPVFNNKKISDHFAIIPTGVFSDQLSDKEKIIYDMVCRRFIACFYPAAKLERTTRVTEVENCQFRASGTIVKDFGWQEVYGGEDDEEKEELKMPDLNGEIGRNAGVSLQQGKTKAPSRFTEATLLGAMENAGRFLEEESLSGAMKERGLGTPATRAAVIEDLLSDKKRYMERGKKKFLIPTDKAMSLIKSLRDHDVKLLTQPDLTAQWEDQLSQIENGELKASVFLDKVRGMVVKFVDDIRESASVDEKVLKCKCGVLSLKNRGSRWKCSSCDFSLYSSAFGHVFDDIEIQSLVEGARTEKICGLKSSKGKIFDASLILDGDGKITLAF